MSEFDFDAGFCASLFNCVNCNIALCVASFICPFGTATNFSGFSPVDLKPSSILPKSDVAVEFTMAEWIIWYFLLCCWLHKFTICFATGSSLAPLVLVIAVVDLVDLVDLVALGYLISQFLFHLLLQVGSNCFVQQNFRILFLDYSVLFPVFNNIVIILAFLPKNISIYCPLLLWTPTPGTLSLFSRSFQHSESTCLCTLLQFLHLGLLGSMGCLLLFPPPLSLPLLDGICFKAFAILLVAASFFPKRIVVHMNSCHSTVVQCLLLLPSWVSVSLLPLFFSLLGNVVCTFISCLLGLYFCMMIKFWILFCKEWLQLHPRLCCWISQLSFINCLFHFIAQFYHW